MSDLVGNPEDRFSHDEVHMTGFEELGVYLIERGADIYKHSKSDPNPLEDAVKKNLKQVG